MAAALIGMMPLGEHEESPLGGLGVLSVRRTPQPLECLPVVQLLGFRFLSQAGSFRLGLKLQMLGQKRQPLRSLIPALPKYDLPGRFGVA